MAETTTPTEALANAVRLLQFAEADPSNLQMMEALTRLAECWVQAATVLRESESE